MVKELGDRGLDQHAVQEVEKSVQTAVCIQAHSPDARRPRRKRDADRRSAGNEGRSRSQRRGVDIGCGMCGKDQCKSRRHNPGSAPQKDTARHTQADSARTRPPQNRSARRVHAPRPQSRSHSSGGPTADVGHEANRHLGGGNHFIELQRDEEGNLWIMILGLAQSRQTGGRLLQREKAEGHWATVDGSSSVPPKYNCRFCPCAPTSSANTGPR